MFDNGEETQPGSPAAVDGRGAPKLDAGRRAFLRGAGLATVGAGVLGTFGTVPTAFAQSAGDAQILNFALNLEYLEAEFYLRAAFGRGLEDSDTTGLGRRGGVRGGRQVNFETSAIRLYAEELAEDEEAHVKFLREVLGNAAVARPLINLDESFTTAARAAGLVGPNEPFDAYANETNFLLAAYIFEDVGVTAYKGAAPQIENRAVLSAAAGLLGTEAYHAGTIRTVCFSRGLNPQTRAISRVRDELGGPRQKDHGVGVRGNRSNITITDQNGLVFGRTVEQVLDILYLGGEGRGGFFPRGVNL